MTLIFLGSAWLAGVALGPRMELPVAAALALIGTLLLFLPFSRKRPEVLGALSLAFFVLGLLRFQHHADALGQNTLARYNGGGPVTLKGEVRDDPEERDVSLRFRLAVHEAQQGGDWEPVSGSALVLTPKYPRYHYGDALLLQGKLETPPILEEFDYREYLARQGISSLMRYPKVERLGDARPVPLLARLYGLRLRLAHSLQGVLPEPQGALAQGMLLGLRSAIPPELADAFARTGATHILAISGHNLTVVAGLWVSIGVWLFGRRHPLSLGLALFVVWAYSLLAGLAPSLLRAALMGSLVLLAAFLGRQASALTSLVAAAALLTAFDPMILWDLGFQLSFMAMVGLIVAPALLEPWTRRIGEAFLARGAAWEWAGPVLRATVSGLVATLGATLFTLPIVAANFHRVSLVGLPATLLALPALPGIILFAALASFLGLFAPLLALPFAWGAWLLTSYMIGVVEFWDSLPVAAATLGPLPSLLPWAYYALFGAFLTSWAQRAWMLERMRRLQTLLSKGGHVLEASFRWSQFPIVAATLALFAGVVWVVALSLPDRRLHVTFLDVGQGDAILVQTSAHQQILIDGGPSPQALATQLGKRLSFWDRSIDLVVLTHPQRDHLTGLTEVVRRYRVGRVVESGVAASTAEYAEWRRLLEEKAIPFTRAQTGQRILLGQDMWLEVLAPTEELLAAANLNDTSVVTRLVTPALNMLFTGDIEEAGERALRLLDLPLESMVLKVPHHGSASSTSPALLRAVQPAVAVISVGADNPYGHPAAQTLERLQGITVLCTHERGSIEFVVEGQRAWVRAQRPRPKDGVCD